MAYEYVLYTIASRYSLSKACFTYLITYLVFYVYLTTSIWPIRTVRAGFVPAIHAPPHARKDVDARDKPRA
jgi:hypothetical protein